MERLRKGDPEDARLRNRYLILSELRKARTLSRADLSRTLNLSKKTVSDIVSHLIAGGYVVEVEAGMTSQKGGRKPILLDLNRTRHSIVGMDIGKTNLNLCIANIKGEIVQKRRIRTPSKPTPNTIVRHIEALSRELLDHSSVSRQSLLGMSISIGGLISKRAGTVLYSPDFGWKDVPLREMVEKAIGQKVAIDNCTRAMALGEVVFGSSLNARSLFYVNIGYGIGSAIVLDGRVYERSSEFGHCFVTEKKGRCDCGKEGCLEAHASGHAIAKEAALRLDTGKRPLEAVDVARMASEGSNEARAILREAGECLGRAISFASNLYNPDRIVLGGGVSGAGDLILKPLLDEYRLRVMTIIGDSTMVGLSSLGADAGIMGAVALGLQSFVFNGGE